MIVDLVAVVFSVIYVIQYKKWYEKNENTNSDNFLFFMCLGSVMLTIALVLFRPLKSVTIRTV